ncbi:hypothetical protein ACFQRB_08655 [Halobaculum litoreum]|uniref:Translocon Sec61/SecY plug domain-containing protein n=1 Tax=Halobaculum litoreum TaxID=3031998 RepID=A0ABD5XSE0_9EURY
MGWKETAEPVLTRMPTVTRPEGHVPFKRKLAWTAGILVMYFFLTNITMFGLATTGAEGDFYGRFRSILAGSQGSILQPGSARSSRRRSSSNCWAARTCWGSTPTTPATRCCTRASRSCW